MKANRATRSVLLLVLLFAMGAQRGTAASEGAMGSAAKALPWSVGGYGTYWHADRYGDGWGGGAKASLQFLEVLVGDVRAGYVEWDSGSVSLVPLEASINLRIPALIAPYAGLGTGYYIASGNDPEADSSAGVFANFGVAFRVMGTGVFFEARYMDLEPQAFDGFSANLGLSWKF